jgi:hypothetical protein
MLSTANKSGTRTRNKIILSRGRDIDSIRSWIEKE